MIATMKSAAIRQLSKRPRYNAEPIPSIFLSPPAIVETYLQFCQQPMPVEYPRGMTYRHGWVKWFDEAAGYGFLQLYDETTHQQSDLYFHAANSVCFRVEAGVGQHLTTIFLHADHHPKESQVRSTGDGDNQWTRQCNITPIPIIKDGAEVRFLYGVDRQRGPYASRWFLVESYRQAMEYAEALLHQLRIEFRKFPRFSLFLEDRDESQVDIPWVELAPPSQLLFETNTYDFLRDRYDLLKSQLNWQVQRLVVIMELIHADGQVETEVACCLEEVVKFLQQIKTSEV